MTKEEAIHKMRMGIKITHRWFDNSEYMTMLGNSIILEDGVKCSYHEFWQWRTDSSWDNNYSMYTENNKALNH